MRGVKVTFLRQVGDGYRIDHQLEVEGLRDMVHIMDSSFIFLNENDRDPRDVIFVPLPDEPTPRELRQLEREFEDRQHLTPSELMDLNIEEELDNIKWREDMRRVFRYLHPDIEDHIGGKLFPSECVITKRDVERWSLERRIDHE